MKLSSYQISYIKDNFPNSSILAISKKLGLSRDIVAYRLVKWGMHQPKPIGCLTKEMESIIKGSYLQIPTKRLARQLKTTPYLINSFLRRENLTIPNHIKTNYKSSSHFKTGLIPFNKGRPAEEWMKSENYEKLMSGYYKGKSIGSIVSRRNGHIPFKLIKTDEGWKLLHHVIWEKINNTIPENHVIVFEDGNYENYDINNLNCISRYESILRGVNQYNIQPDAIKSTLSLIYKLAYKIQQHESK